MDDAERWLQDNDPNYSTSVSRWKNVKSGIYRIPRQEIPWGNAQDLAELVDARGGDYVESVPRRACERCHFLFVPQTPWHRFCSRACKHQARRRRGAPHSS